MTTVVTPGGVQAVTTISAQGFCSLISRNYTFRASGFRALRVIVDEETGEPWFIAKDVCDSLGVGYASAATKYLDQDEQAVITNPSLTANPNGKLVIVSESGLYSLILRSRKPEAKQFKRWVTHEVLPAIRKHSGYLTPKLTYDALTDPDVIINLA